MKDRSFFRKIMLSAAFGLFLFWAIEGAVCRRIGFDLFLPVQAGLFLPGRAARLCAALVVCFALTLTERGKALCRAVNSAMEKDRFRWLAAIVVTGLFLVWSLRITVVSFMTNDDTTIMKAIGRIPTEGLAAAATSFSHILFCAFIGFFYRLAPGGYWYAGYHLAAIAVSTVIIGRCIFLKAQKRGWPFLAGLAVHLLLCCGLFLFSISRLSFTVTPAIVGTAAVALILCRGETDGRLGHILMDCGSIILILLCRLQRTSTGKSLMCFWALAVGYQLLKLLLDRREGQAKRIAWFAAGAAVTAGLFFGAGKINFNTLDSTAQSVAEYKAADRYRSIVTDYLLSDLTDEQLEVVGIPPELSMMLRNWYFMDERVNTETFKALVDLYYTGENASSEPLGIVLSNFLAALKTNMSSARIWQTSVAAGFLFLLAALAFLRFGRAYWPEILCAMGALGGGAILCLYLTWQGRFPVRAFLVVAVPAVVTLLLMALDAPARADDAPAKTAPALTAFSGLLIVGLVAMSALLARSVPYVLTDSTRDEVFANQLATENYANSHPDITFVRSFTTYNLDPFHDVRLYPDNLPLWGGTSVIGSSNRLYADAFFRDDVQFMTDQNSAFFPLVQYLSLDFGPVQAATLARLTDIITVADISQITPGDGYTGWYEQNGLTYYFEDGRAVTGTRIIDGEEYTFAAPGASANPIILPNPTGIVYATDAYSLISGE